MKKKIVTCIMASVMAFSAVATACDQGGEENHELVWSNYVEKEYAYVSDMYYYNVPTVKDENGTNYEVFVDVTQESGEAVDYFGGFFAIEKPTEYSVVYTVDDGKKEYSKTTTVVGIDKAKYSLTDASNVIFTVGEEISLDGMLDVSVEGEVVYSVKKGEETIEIDDSAFTPTQAGVYTVQASMDKQPTHTFNLHVYDKAQRYLADGMILDGTSSQDIQVNAHNDYTASISFDETVKYDSASNGSYKIKATTDGVLTQDHRTLSFRLQPTYNSEYYKALQNQGYKYVAIRYMIESSTVSGTASFQYADAHDKNRCGMYIYHNGEKIVNTPNTYAFFGNGNLKYVPNGEWAEMLLDIKMFEKIYTQGAMQLFRFVVNKGSSWDLTMYIDNIYAVKEREEIKVVDKGTQIDLSGMKIEGVYFDGKEISVTDNKLSVDKYGLYEIETIDRTVYGRKQAVMAKGTNTVVPFDVGNFSAKHGNATSSVETFEIEKVNNEIAVTADSSVWNTNTWQRVVYIMKPLNSKVYYTTLQNLGYEYITYEYTLNYGNNTYAYTSGTPSVYRVALTRGALTHYNDLKPLIYNEDGGLKEGNTATHQWKCVLDNTTGNTADKQSGNKSFWATNTPDAWNQKTFIVSISIKDFLSLYNSDGMNMLTLYFAHAQTFAYTVTFGKIQATTQACVFDA